MTQLTKEQISNVQNFINTDDGIFETVQGCLERAIEALSLPKDLDRELEVDYLITVAEAKEGITLNKDEIYVLRLLLLNAWNARGSMQFREMLGDEANSEVWLDDTLCSMTEKVGINNEDKY